MNKPLVRDASVKSRLKKSASGAILTTHDCHIEVPSRFFQRGLGGMGEQTLVYGLFPIIFSDGKYTLFSLCAVARLKPYAFTRKEIGEEEYTVFHFKAGEPVYDTHLVVKVDTLMFNVIDEFVFKGKVPWYVNPVDLAKHFDTAKSHADSGLASNLQVIEFVVSLISRAQGDRSKLLRLAAKAQEDFEKGTFVALSSVHDSVKSPLNKIAGAYMSEGVISAVLNPADRPEYIERVLRA